MKAVQYRYSEQRLGQRARYLVALLSATHKRAIACWFAILIIGAVGLVAEVAAQPLSLLASIGAGLLVGDQLVQWAHEYVALLTDRWAARPPSAYARRYRARPKWRLAGAAVGAIVAGAAWSAFHAPEPALLSSRGVAIAVAKTEKLLKEAADLRGAKASSAMLWAERASL